MRPDSPEWPEMDRVKLGQSGQIWATEIASKSHATSIPRLKKEYKPNQATMRPDFVIGRMEFHADGQTNT